MLMRKLVVLTGLCLAGVWVLQFQSTADAARSVELALHEFREPADVVAAREEWWWLAMRPAFVIVGLLAAAGWLFRDDWHDLRSAWFSRRQRPLVWLMAAALPLSLTGCVKPFEPIVLEVIKPNETAFLLPLLGDPKNQAAINSEEYLRANLVQMQQVRIPQQWVQKGYQYVAYNGAWRDAAVLIRVDRSPVTRVWTADKNTGTSNRDEAIWVMTSDQVEFSTGWTCTAFIPDHDSAVKFLYYYPNGTIADVMDREVRARLQAAFGIAVTDRPMQELRTGATPVIQGVMKDVTAFFAERGVVITNLGIEGGFIYRDPSIMKTLVEVFNAEQQKNKEQALLDAQTITNKRVLAERQSEADGIKLVSDAKQYEAEQAKENLELYVKLKQLEIEKERAAKWDGRYPVYYMASGSSSPDLMLQMQMPKLAGE
ncbi:MAG TPA: hypothetical protein VM165_06700 [Planctomycetaceae bacterium]|nr:hypothetical protein [Planctomycetaceae bacterium]